MPKQSDSDILRSRDRMTVFIAIHGSISDLHMRRISVVAARPIQLFRYFRMGSRPEMR